MLRTRFHLIPMYDTPTEADTTWNPNNEPMIQETPKPNKRWWPNVDHIKTARQHPRTPRPPSGSLGPVYQVLSGWSN